MRIDEKIEKYLVNEGIFSNIIAKSKKNKIMSNLNIQSINSFNKLDNYYKNINDIIKKSNITMDKSEWLIIMKTLHDKEFDLYKTLINSSIWAEKGINAAKMAIVKVGIRKSDHNIIWKIVDKYKEGGSVPEKEILKLCRY